MIIPTLLVLAVTAALSNCNPVVHLPPDAEFVTIVGDGFKLQVSKLDDIKNKWNTVVNEAELVDESRKKDVNTPVVNKDLFRQIMANGGQKELGPMSKELHDWIDARARALNDRVERYDRQLVGFKNQQRVVAQVLLLNTLVDLDNLVNENIKSLKWVKKKLRSYKSLREEHANSVEEWIKSKIDENKKIEKKIRGTNNPGDKWLINTKAIKRILLEQHFSESISKLALEYIGGSFAMMERSRVYDLFTKDKKIDDGLYYQGSNEKIPAHFPFSAQDAIVNEQ